MTTDLMDTIRTLPDPALRAVIAKALGWRARKFVAGWMLITPDGKSWKVSMPAWDTTSPDWPDGNTSFAPDEDAAWNCFDAPNWLGDLNAAWALATQCDFYVSLRGGRTSARAEFRIEWGDLAPYLFEEGDDEHPARVLCIGWCAAVLDTGGEIADRLRAAAEEMEAKKVEAGVDT
jgi:hypothetical protein